MTEVPLLQFRGIKKSFGAVQVLRGVDMSVNAGEVTALVGDNGAGKSTLIKGIAGLHHFEEGKVFWRGKEVYITNPKIAASIGIEFVYQDLALCDNLDVVRNMFLGRERRRGLFLDEDAMEVAAREVLASLSVTTIASVRQPVASLSGGQRQSIAVAKSFMWHSQLVVLDEPTAALGVEQTQHVLNLMRRLADKGLGVILISHNLEDVLKVADRIAVLRLGRIVAEVGCDEVGNHELVSLITTGAGTGARIDPPSEGIRSVR